MPGIFSHLAVIDLVRQSDATPGDIRALLSDDDKMKFAYYGSLGPDFLFFNLPEFPSVFGIVDFGLKIHRQFKDVFEFKDRVDAIYRTMQDVIPLSEWLSLEPLVDTLRTKIMATLEEFTVKHKDLFELMPTPMNEKPNNIGDWYWSDITHHHQTGEFVRTLWSKAGNDNELKAYCAGYISHVGTDVVGHGLVNSFVGGPYRHHWRRHVVIEYALNTILWEHQYSTPDKTADISASEFYKKIDFRNVKNQIELPEKLAELFADSLKSTYEPFAKAHNIHFKYEIPNKTDISQMYEIMHAWIEGMTSWGLFSMPEPDPNFDWFDLPEVIRKKFEDLWNDRPGVVVPPLTSGFNLNKWAVFLAQLAKLALWCLDTALIIAQLPLYVIARLQGTPARFLVWMLIKLIYESYENTRLFLALSGWVHPEFKQIAGNYDGVLAVPDDVLSYPNERIPPNKAQTYQLTHPQLLPPPERPANELPYTSSFLRPLPKIQDAIEVLLGLPQEVDNPYSSGLFQICQGRNLDEIQKIIDQGKVVSAPMLASQLLREFVDNGGRDIPNWNLDADRGYGHPSWRTAKLEPWSSIADFKLDC